MKLSPLGGADRPGYEGGVGGDGCLHRGAGLVEGVDEGGDAGVCFCLRGEDSSDGEEEKRSEPGGVSAGEAHLKRLACAAREAAEYRL